jgi:hypothetical protein
MDGRRFGWLAGGSAPEKVRDSFGFQDSRCTLPALPALRLFVIIVQMVVQADKT